MNRDEAERFVIQQKLLQSDDIKLFQQAAYNGSLDVIKVLVEEYNCDPTISDNNGRTPLHTSCACGHLKVVKYLITECNCNPMCVDNDGDCPLYAASLQNQLEVIKYLINDCNCDPTDNHNQLGMTPLHAACYMGHIDVVRYYIEECKCDPMCNRKDGSRHLLHEACDGGHLNIVKYLITECNCDPMCRDSNGDCPLYIATLQNQLEVIKYLINDCNCDPTDNDNQLGKTPLHEACYTGHIDVVRYYIEECKCDPMCKRKDHSWNSLHEACASGQLNIVKYLIKECKCDSMCRANNGDCPLYTASSKNQLEVIKYLINDCNCDPTDNDNQLGKTPLHTACYWGHIDVVRYYIEECKCDPMCKRKDHSWNSLHEACAGGHLNIVKYLIKECKCDSMCRDNIGDCPLYIASSNNQLEVIKYLINDYNCDPTDNDNQLSTTPLHAACYWGHIDVVRYYIEECKCDPMCKSTFLDTPLYYAVTQHHYDIARYLVCTGKVDIFSRDTFFLSPNFLVTDEPTKMLFNKFSQIKSCTPVDSYMNIFLLGNSGVGKTTLTQVIKKRANGVFLGKLRSVSNVELLTAGIIPHTLEHSELGNIILHDLAGQPEYYSSHSAILENILNGSAAVFIIVVKLSDDPPYKWLNLVKNLSSKCPSVCYVLTVASHKDTVKHVERKHCKQLLNSKIEEFLNDAKNLTHIGIVSLDCRKLDGEEFSDFKDSLSKACQSIRNSTNMFDNVDSKVLIYCRMLYKLLQSKDQSVYTFDSVCEMMIERCSDLYLPETIEELEDTLCHLHRTGLIMFIKSSESDSWIVTRKQSLLAEVNGMIFSPLKKKDFNSNTGIVSEDTISQYFPLHDRQMLVEFLVSMKLCERITPDLIQLTNLTVNDIDSNRNALLFFPALMTLTQRPTISSDVLQFGWCLQCTNPWEEFSPRFLHLLILQLAYLPELLKTQDNPHDRRCTLWSTGIMWCSRLGITTLVELVDDSKCVIVLMSSQEGLQHNMIPVRRSVIADIISLQQECCPSIQPKEFVINPSQLHYPIDNPCSLVLYDIEGIASAVFHNEPCVTSFNSRSEMIKLCELFPMEHDKGKRMSIFVGRNLESLKLPGGKSFPNIVSSAVDVHTAGAQDIVSVLEKPDIEDTACNLSVHNAVLSTQDMKCTCMPQLLHHKNQTTSVSSSCPGHEQNSRLPVCDQVVPDNHNTIPSPVDVLRKHSATISKILSNPESLADHLHSKELISDDVMDDILTTKGIPRSTQARIVMNEVLRNFLTGDQLLKFNIVCETLEQIDSTGVMREVIREMERDIGNIDNN